MEVLPVSCSSPQSYHSHYYDHKNQILNPRGGIGSRVDGIIGQGKSSSILVHT